MAEFDAVVFGAGISGLSISHSLIRQGQKVLLIDPYKTDLDSYLAPAGLVNVSAGMRAKLSWRGVECYQMFKKRIAELEKSSGRDDLFRESGVLRPAVTDKLAENFKQSPQRYDWPEGWIKWLDAEKTHALNPVVNAQNGALYLQMGMTVFVDNYLSEYRKELEKEGLVFLGEQAHYQRRSSEFQITSRTGRVAGSDRVVVAAGDGLAGFADWKKLPLQYVKGELVLFESDSDLSWDHAISAKGYLLRRGDRLVIAGATYDHHFKNLNTTSEAYDEIREKLGLMVPELTGKLTKRAQFAGVRVTTPDHKPVIGPHDEVEGLYIYTAMGSKGLLYSEYLASLLADNMVNGEQIPQQVDVQRFQ